MADAPIEPIFGARKKMVAFVYRQGRHEIAKLVDHWTMTREWWNDPDFRPGHPPKQDHFYRVMTKDGGMWDIYRSHEGQWFLYHIWD